MLEVSLPFWLVGLMTLESSGHFGSCHYSVPCVKAPVRWSQPMHFPSAVSESMMVLGNSRPNSVTITVSHRGSCHYSGVFYTLMTFDQNLTISQKTKKQKTKGPFPPNPEKEVSDARDFGSAMLLISMPQGSVITAVRLVQSHQVFLKPKGVFIFFSRGQHI